MAQLIIKGSQAVLLSISAILDEVAGLGREAAFEVNLVADQVEPAKGRVLRPKVRYYAKDVSAEAIRQAVATLGEHTVIGIVYKDVDRATVEARRHGDRRVLETTRSLAERRHFNQKGMEWSLVQLRAAGLVESESVA